MCWAEVSIALRYSGSTGTYDVPLAPLPPERCFKALNCSWIARDVGWNSSFAGTDVRISGSRGPTILCGRRLTILARPVCCKLLAVDALDLVDDQQQQVLVALGRPLDRLEVRSNGVSTSIRKRNDVSSLTILEDDRDGLVSK